METEIDGYEVMYSSNAKESTISLSSKNKVIGMLIFEPNGSQLPPVSVDDEYVVLFYHLDDYKNIVDLLRNERPVYLQRQTADTAPENGIHASRKLATIGAVNA